MANGFGRWTRLILGIVAGCTVASRAQADALLDFGVIFPTTGSISYAGGVAPLVGSGIDVDNIVGAPSGTTVACVGCILNFTTGGLVSADALTNSWTFGGGPSSSISIVGAAPAAGIPSSATLLSGAFGTAMVQGVGSTFKVAIAGFTDVKDDRLLAFFGLPTGIPYIGNFNISFMATGVSPSAFTSSGVLSGDVVNTPTPEPGTMLLLGSGLMGFGYLARRRRRKD